MKVRHLSTKVSEKDLVSPVCRLFPRARYACAKEAAFNFKSIDLLFRDRSTGCITAVELKLRDWRKALRQAATYQLCATYACVAMWHVHLTRDRVAIMARHGLGVISVLRRKDGLHAQVIVKPKKSRFVRRGYARTVEAVFGPRKRLSGAH